MKMLMIQFSTAFGGRLDRRGRTASHLLFKALLFGELGLAVHDDEIVRLARHILLNRTAH